MTTLRDFSFLRMMLDGGKQKKRKLFENLHFPMTVILHQNFAKTRLLHRGVCVTISSVHRSQKIKKKMFR